MTRCRACRGRIDRERSWYRIDRGTLIDGSPVPGDRDYCTLACLYRDLGQRT